MRRTDGFFKYSANTVVQSDRIHIRFSQQDYTVLRQDSKMAKYFIGHTPSGCFPDGSVRLKRRTPGHNWTNHRIS